VTSLRPAAVLWDMDGTLVDTEPYWMVAEGELVSSFGGTWTDEDALQLVGSGLWHSARILQAKGVALTEDEIIEQLTTRVLEQVTVEVPWRPGARELLFELHELGVPTALVTMSIRRMAEHIAASIGFDGFAAIIGGDDVEHSKPHPQPYLVGAQALGVSASDCVALEDSAPGVASAVAAGAVVIAVPMHVPLIDDPAYDLHDMSGLTAADLFDIYASRRA
jgi:HAD superfamily hydrolase (TIGR01509 family)